MSQLSFQKIDDFIIFLSRMDKKNLDILANLFEKQPEWILKYYQNIQTKKAVIRKKDKKAWNELVKKEVMDLLKIK